MCEQVVVCKSFPKIPITYTLYLNFFLFGYGLSGVSYLLKIIFSGFESGYGVFDRREDGDDLVELGKGNNVLNFIV